MALIAAMAVGVPAHGQGSSAPPREGASTLDAHARSELASINTESTIATVLYATGIPLAPLGVLTALGGALASSGGNSDTGVPLMVAGLAGAGVGTIAVAFAIGLDIGSGSRRRRWRQQYGQSARAVFFAIPVSGGGVVTMSLRF